MRDERGCVSVCVCVRVERELCVNSCVPMTSGIAQNLNDAVKKTVHGNS